MTYEKDAKAGMAHDYTLDADYPQNKQAAKAYDLQSDVSSGTVLLEF